MQSEMKPCPFCGCEKILNGYIRDGREIVCGECRASVVAFHPDASKRAAERWNRRAEAALSAAEPVVYVSRKSLEQLNAEGSHVAVQTLIHRVPLRSGNGVPLFAGPLETTPSVAVKALEWIVQHPEESNASVWDVAKNALSAQVQDAAAKSLADAYQKYLDASHLYNERLAISKTKALGTMRVDEEYRAIDEARRAFDKLAVDIAKSALPAAPAKQEG